MQIEKNSQNDSIPGYTVTYYKIRITKSINQSIEINSESAF